MIRAIESLKVEFSKHNAEVFCPEFQQTLSVPELLDMVPRYDGWIIGDDPATTEVFSAGKNGRLRAAIKWGAGTDNVDFSGAAALGFDVENTPGTFGEEVSDVALAYLIGLARHLFLIDRQVRAGNWPKPAGRSLQSKIVGIVGYGHIGLALRRKVEAIGMSPIIYDPAQNPSWKSDLPIAIWPDRLDELDFLVLACALTPANRHLINSNSLLKMKKGVMIINVARGGLIDQEALRAALDARHVSAAALEVLEDEPPEKNEALLSYENCVFGSHNSSNAVEAVYRTSMLAIQLLFRKLGLNK
jgi:D-3-phosphoglycerate dehydrogenase